MLQGLVKKKPLINRIRIGEDQTLSIRRWHLLPQLTRAVEAASTDMKGNDLKILPGEREPDPEVILLASYKRPEFIHGHLIVALVEQKCLSQWCLDFPRKGGQSVKQ